MKVGVNLMTRGIGADSGGQLQILRQAETLGFDYIAVNDHVVAPGGIESIYPYSKDGIWGGAASGECLDVLAVLGFLAGASDRIGLLSSVLVLPHRPAVQTAKTLATIDRLSGGRLTVGCGAGWMREEFEALGAPEFSERGKVSDEYIEAFRDLWTNEVPSFEGAHVAYDNIRFEPKPARAGGPPIWIGGESPAAIARTARLGDGWYPASLNPKFPLTTATQMAAGIDRLNRACDKIGRDPATLDISYFTLTPLREKPIPMPNGDRYPFSGPVADILADFAAFDALGVTSIIVNVQQPELNATLDQISWCAEKILPALRP